MDRKSSESNVLSLSSSANALEVKDLSKVYHRSSKSGGVVKVNLTVRNATLHGFLGPNGAGKTTTMKCIMGLLRKTSGKILVFGEEIRGDDDIRSRRRIGYSPEIPSFPPYLNGREVLVTYGRIRGIDRSKLLEESNTLLKKVGLDGASRQLVGEYSRGMQARLGLAVAQLGNPDLLLLDEPMDGVDPLGVIQIREMLKQMIAEGRTILFSSHQLSEVQKMCDTVTIVNNGITVAEGSLRELIKDWNHGLVFTAEFTSLNQEFVLSLKRMEGISEVTTTKENTIRLVAMKDCDIRPILAKTAVEQGVFLLSCEEETSSLEELFISLVKKENNSR